MRSDFILLSSNLCVQTWNALASKQALSWILMSQMRLKKSGELGDEGEEKSRGGGGRWEEEEGRQMGGGDERIADEEEEEGKSFDLSAGCVSSTLLILCLRRKSASHSS